MTLCGFAGVMPQDELVLEPGRPELGLHALGVRRAATEWVFTSDPIVGTVVF